MAQILVRNLDDEVVARLKRKAAEKNRSLEAEVRALLTEAAEISIADANARIAALRERIGPPGPDEPDAMALLREGREHLDARLPWSSTRRR